MRFLLSLTLIMSCLILGACCGASGDQISYVPPDSPAGQLCAAHCGDVHNTCQEDCSFQQRECLNKAQGQALVDYEQYMSEPFLHANAIEHHIHDFEHLEPCESAFNSCSAACEMPYQTCFEKCGGTIEKPMMCEWLR